PVVLLRRVHNPAEDVQRVDVVEPVRAAGQIGIADEGKVDAVLVVDEYDERLAEEERDYREVVADEAARREADYQPDERRDGDREQDRELRLPVPSGVRRRDEAVGVRTEAEERDVAEIEQAREADGDVEAEPEQ